MCHGQITLLKNNKICPLAIPKQISTISRHIPSFMKIITHHYRVTSYKKEKKKTTEAKQIILKQFNSISFLKLSIILSYSCTDSKQNLQLTLKTLIKFVADDILKLISLFFKDNRTQHFFCESSAHQMIHKKCQA